MLSFFVFDTRKNGVIKANSNWLNRKVNRTYIMRIDDTQYELDRHAYLFFCIFVSMVNVAEIDICGAQTMVIIQFMSVIYGYAQQ